MRTAGRNSDGLFNPWAVRQNSIPASFNMEALLGASSQCLSSVKEIKRAKKRSLRSKAVGNFTGTINVAPDSFIAEAR